MSFPFNLASTKVNGKNDELFNGLLNHEWYWLIGRSANFVEVIMTCSQNKQLQMNEYNCHTVVDGAGR
jgi:hypothetical protein